ncbi:ion channel TACAN-like [Hydractinia symbiolongicarpus]|uniref:ion channel TACAN-like n=1 Tax=Hydractinia symbiolongicarpus TaxID=13093 RepID=UPI00254FF0F3|nr:ion channel TACAN-like [Hydractinia symbiolongicarpus]
MAASIREITSIEEWEKEWDGFENNIKKLKENEYAKLLQLMDEYRNAQAKLQKGVDYQLKNVGAFAKSLKAVGRKQTSSKEKENFLEMTKKLNGIQCHFDELQQALPKKAGWFLRACIGEINVSLFWQKQHYKDVYEKFKLKTMMIAMVFALFNLFVVHSRFFDALFNGILVWYYSSLTLQEQILRANGSRIKGWYVTHHYLSILMSGFLLIWPKSVTYQLFRTQFYYFALYLSFVQFLQYHYQHGMLYRMRALGRGSNMDLTQDVFRSYMLKGLTFLVPFLVAGYIFQLYNGYVLYRLSQHEECREWQVLASSLLFFVIAVGNIYTLAVVLRQKATSTIRLPCG